MDGLTIIDWGIWLVYFVLIGLILFFYSLSKEESYSRYFLTGFAIKVFGGVAFVLIYMYYYGFGDTFLYYEGANTMADLAIDRPAVYMDLLFSGSHNLDGELADYAGKITFSRTYEEWFMVKLLSPLSLLSFKSYLVLTLLLSFISFWGSWKLFKVFADILPSRKMLGFIAAFLIPSVVFWGGGVLKDTITLACINYIIYITYFSFFKGRFSVFSLLKISLAALIILNLKAYIIIAFVPGIVFGLYLHFKKKIQILLLRLLVGPLLLITFSAGAIYLLQNVFLTSEKYDAEMLDDRVKGFHSWHTDVGGSSYDLGDIEYTATGVVRKIPAALNVTFFRPYMWEAGNPVVLISALESLAFLLLFVYAILLNWRSFFSNLSKQPFLYGLLLYSLVFGFAVGFTSYNFGALMRYKIPIYSIVVFIMMYMIVTARAKAKSNDKTVLSPQTSY